MAILVKHNKVSTVPDDADTSLVRPSDWNADHTLTGFGTAAEKDAGVANGVATLDSGGKVPQSQIPLMGDLNYQGTWNASTNTPTLTSSVGTKGYYYVVDVAGSTNLNGITDWQVGDWAIFKGTVWQKVDNTDAVTSVNGQTGTVVLTTTNIAEGTNEYFTQSRARQSISAGTGISYDNSTGVVTNAAPDQTVSLTGAGTTAVTGTYPNFTITSNDQYVGTVTSVGVSSSATALTVSNSPITTSGNIGVNFAGTPNQYVRGDGTLATFQTTGGGGSSVSYYLNGGTSQGTFGGTTYYQMSKSAVVGSAADFTIGANGYIASFITDANDPAQLTIPAGNWNFEMYFSASSSGGTPSFYLELYKYDGSTFTLIASNSGTPEGITGGTSIDLYITALAVPATTLTVTDRLAIRVYVNHSSKTITLHTQDNHLCQVITTFSTGITALNGLTAQVQNFATGTSGTDFNISSSTATHTFNIPTASSSNRGLLSTTDWTTFNNKVTSVSGTTGRITSSGGTTPAIDLASGIVTAGTTGSSTLIPVITVDTYGRVTNVTTAANPQGTVTSVSALTLGTTGTDLSSTVANSTTTPVITLNVPTASATNRGALSSADWTTFNSKAAPFTYTTNYIPFGQGTTTPNQSANLTFDGTTQSAPVQRASNGIVTNNKTIGTSFTIPSTDNATSAGPVTLSSGVTVTVSSGSRWVVL